VRLHKYSLGRADYRDSVHWQRGLILEDDTGARAFLEHIGTRCASVCGRSIRNASWRR